MRKHTQPVGAVHPLPIQRDLFAGLGEAVSGRDAEIIPFPKSPIHEATAAAFQPRNTRNFRITTELDSLGSPDQKFRQNLLAIETLKRIEVEHRDATDAENEALVRYTGWGGLPQAFDLTESARKPEWSQALKGILTEAEWESARASVNNAHYTDPVVIRFIWDALARMGFKGGRVLEPAAGIGHFVGCMPAEIAAVSKVSAVEIDSLSARILSRLYPDIRAFEAGFERTAFGPQSFDVVVSNVPFGNYRVFDPKYDRMKLPIHDYFFAKSIDRVRPGGIVALVTSRYTLDKHRKSFREYLAHRAELVAAIRLPGGAFQRIANTEVVTDVLFLKRREAPVGPKDVEECDWTAVEIQDEALKNFGYDRIWANGYFNRHPTHLIGRFELRRGAHSQEDLDVVHDGDLGEALDKVLQDLPSDIYTPVLTAVDERHPQQADTPVHAGAIRPGGHAIVGDMLMVNDGQGLVAVDRAVSAKVLDRARGMLALRDCVRSLLRLELEGGDGSALRTELNGLYDRFLTDHGPLWSRANRAALRGDPDLPLLLSLEIYDDERETATKASIFTARTVSVSQLADTADNLSEAVALSLNRYGNLAVMAIARWLGIGMGAVEEQLVTEDMAYRDPTDERWVMRDEYLSGDVRAKLALAETAARSRPEFARNVEALRPLVPRDLRPDEIDARLGASWIPAEDVEAFVDEILEAGQVKVAFEPAIGTWTAECQDNGWAKRATVCIQTYGTPRVNAVKLIEDALNQRTPTVYDQVEVDGSTRSVVNPTETVAAREKWHKLRDAFREWVWRDEERALRLAARYNVLFNSTISREFDGSHLVLPGFNPNFVLRAAQKNAIWRILVSASNTLLAHAVGAGKTAVQIAAGMEAKRLGLCNKPLYVVPNHMLEQFAAEYLRLYPSANILVAGKEDLGTDRRQRMLARIATGNWDGVIVTHASFEKLPISDTRVKALMVEEAMNLEDAIRAAKAGDENNTRLVKQIEAARKRLMVRLEGMLGRHRKDQGLAFEALGVDMLFVDEAHLFKNLWLSTKMTRVAGLPQVSSLRAFDLFMKVRAIGDARGDRRGVVFATATPIANAVAELYTMQRYLQRDTLEAKGIGAFDNWAGNFGETVSSIELAPDGSGYRLHTRFCRYVNLPELMAIFREVADIQTKAMLQLPEPELAGGSHQVVKMEASAALKAYVEELVARAEAIRNPDPEMRPDPSEDNMLMVTNDGRKAALDMRLVNAAAGDHPGNKVNAAAREIHAIWRDTAAQRLTQLVFCDLSTPSSDGSFSVYNDLRAKLLAAGVPAEEIAFIHDFDSDTAKAGLFRRVREGRVRILMGSTQKLGFGTNVQDRLYAEHHLDAPWRPSDVEQRDGRILRPGNGNATVRIFRYVTEGSFDAYIWQTLETKMRFIAQVMTDRGEIRSVEEVELAALSYAEVKAIASGNPMVLEKAGVDAEVAKLAVLARVHQKRRDEMGWQLRSTAKSIDSAGRRIEALEADIATRDAYPGAFALKAGGLVYSDRKSAGEYLLMMAKLAKESRHFEPTVIGSYGPFTLEAGGSWFGTIRLCGAGQYNLDPNTSGGAVTIIENRIRGFERDLVALRAEVSRLREEQRVTAEEMQKPFEHEARLHAVTVRQRELEDQLGITESQGDQVAADPA